MRAPWNCEQCPARGHCLFHTTAPEVEAELGELRAVRSYEPGQPIFYEDAPSFAVYCVADGEVKLWRAGLHGEVKVVGLRHAGDLLGCRAVLSGAHYTATAEPLRPTHVCVIPRSGFMRAVQAEPALAQTLLRRLASSTIESEEQLVARALQSVRQRAARFLLRQFPADQATAAGPVVLEDMLPRAEIADLIGTTPETLSRTLASWVSRGILVLGRNRIEVRDPEALRRIAR